MMNNITKILHRRLIGTYRTGGVMERQRQRQRQTETDRERERERERQREGEKVGEGLALAICQSELKYNTITKRPHVTGCQLAYTHADFLAEPGEGKGKKFDKNRLKTDPVATKGLASDEQQYSWVLRSSIVELFFF